MNIILQPKKQVSGEITIPPSKSHAQRVLACALISENQTIIHNLGASNDEVAALNIVKSSNRKVEEKADSIIISGKGDFQIPEGKVDFHESGLSSRMFTPILATSSQELELVGSGSLPTRPMDIFDELLPRLGVDFRSEKGKLPFKVQGPMQPKNIEIDGSLSSQFITGFIYGFCGSKSLENQQMKLINPKSVPYIELSLDVLKEFGVNLKIENNTIQFNGPYKFQPTEIYIEGDWSSASFFLVAAAILGELTFTNMNPNSCQADIKMLVAIEDFGAQVSWKGSELMVQKDQSKGFEFDATDCPDLFPPLAVLASFADGESRIRGVKRLFAKESDRAATIQSELGKLGANIRVEDDTMIIHPAGQPKSFQVDSCNDHRIAMACAIYGLKLDQAIEISNAEAVNKSFPSFYELLKSVIS
ncbi:MAG: 3-phosphoshikimate 1-carboxyvinyltransferase [Crocinitomicaceae bacterium]|nr:3-phosphoshikimate 1-carboxyvinyltransferase [Crocinitomicaceae bacterium]